MRRCRNFVEPAMDKKKSDSSGGVLGAIIVFFYFASLVFIHAHSFWEFNLFGEIIIGTGAGIFAVVIVYAAGLALKRAKGFSARVFRAVAVGLLLNALVILP